MRFIEINFHNLPKILIFSCFGFLSFCASISPIHAQDVPKTEKRKTIKPKETKKSAIGSLKNNASAAKNKTKNTSRKPVSESNGTTSASKKNPKTTAGISGIVRLKQPNRTVAGVLIEAIRADTKEMLDSTQTNAAGKYRFSNLPSGVALIFLVSSPKTEPVIFHVAVENGMKNLDFTVFPKL